MISTNEMRHVQYSSSKQTTFGMEMVQIEALFFTSEVRVDCTCSLRVCLVNNVIVLPRHRRRRSQSLRFDARHRHSRTFRHPSFDVPEPCVRSCEIPALRRPRELASMQNVASRPPHCVACRATRVRERELLVTRLNERTQNEWNVQVGFRVGFAVEFEMFLITLQTCFAQFPKIHSLFTHSDTARCVSEQFVRVC